LFRYASAFFMTMASGGGLVGARGCVADKGESSWPEKIIQAWL